MFKVVHDFYDLQDSDYIYHIGDKYPRDGHEVDSARIKELSGKSNKIGKVLIEEIKEPVKKQAKTRTKKADE